MANKSTIFYCTECGNETSKWAGKCNACGAWNSLVEEKATGKVKNNKCSTRTGNSSKKLKEIKLDDSRRIHTGMEELDIVLGGGLVAGSVVLLGGDPGIGKSTILLQICDALTKEGCVLYVSGEESSSQIKLRAERIGVESEELSILSENNLDTIEKEISRLKPQVIIADSVQTIISPELTAAAGSVSQVREVAAVFTQIAKTTGSAVFLVGHVTKEGALAGPRVLEHIVDTVLYFEGDRYESYRVLRAVKNRFGSTNEIGVFEMKEIGFAEVKNPSGLFINEDDEIYNGCSVACVLEGTRPVLVETQALASETTFGNPRRMAAGIDYNRLNLISAVLDKNLSLKLGNHDIYLNLVGGLKTDDRAADLSVAAAIISSVIKQSIPRKTAYIGEISLTGEIRPVSNIEKRISECEKLGFEKIYIPYSSKKSIKNKNIIGIRNINDLKNSIL